MPQIRVDLIAQGAQFVDFACPHCGAATKLDVSIEGYWDCEDCGGDFEIAFARLTSLTPLNVKTIILDFPDAGAVEAGNLSSKE